MSGWLRSIQGQITDFAQDVLNEATEDVVDAESELQVARRQCNEAERALIQEQQKVSALENKLKDADQKLYETHVEMDAIGSRYGSMIQSRDDEIKKLKIQLEQSRTIHDGDFSPMSGCLEERVSELTREVAHWKSVAQNTQQQKQAGSSADAELKKQLEEERNRKEAEIAALVSQHAHNTQELREEYEKRITALQTATVLSELDTKEQDENAKKEAEIANLVSLHSQNIKELRDEYEEKIASLQMASSSESNQSDLLDAVLLEKEELLEEKKRLEEMVRHQTEQEKPVFLDYPEGSFIVDLEDRLKVAESGLAHMNSLTDEIDKKNEEILNFRRQNDELTLAYNDLNMELETVKESHGQQTINNHDLLLRIDNLKASLIEYEERYEMCKRDNMETVKQLENLTKQFDRLKSTFDDSKERALTTDANLNTEVDRLRHALDQSKYDRDRLREDVDKFRSAVDSIDTELQSLRDSNRRLAEENIMLSDSIDKYDESVKELMTRNDEQMTTFRIDFQDIQSIHAAKDANWERMCEELRTKCALYEEELEKARAQGYGTSQVTLKDDDQEHIKETQANVEHADQPESSGDSTAPVDLEAHLVELDKLMVEMESQERRLETNELKRREQMEAMSGLSSVVEGISKKIRSAAEQGADHGRDVADDMHPTDISVEALSTQLQEALTAINEKTDECELLREEKETVERELQMRQSVVDEMISQTNVLQMQQQHSADTIKQLRHELTEKEKKYYEKERELMRAEEKLNSLLQKGEKGESEESSESECLDSASVLKNAARDSGRLREQNAQLLEQVAKLGTAKAELEQSLAELKAAHAAVKASSEQLEQIYGNEKETTKALSETVAVLEQKLQKLDVERNNLKATRDEAEAQGVPSESREQVEAEWAHKYAALEQAYEQLKEIATTKHNESLSYYNKVEETLRENDRLGEVVRQEQEALTEAQTKLHEYVQECEKRGLELHRLKEHLLFVEESSTKELIEAEKRETTLRDEIKALREVTHNASESVLESTQHYQAELRILQTRVVTAEANEAEWRDKYEEESRERAETQYALSSLQGVVREMASEQERDNASASHRHLQLQQNIAQLSKQLSEMSLELERIGLDKQAAEEQTESYKEQLSAKQRIVEELEVQLEEARAPKDNSQSSQYRLDDTTLRQLFLSYFLAPVDKKPDVALLLASILEYSEEEREKIRQVVRPQGNPPRGRHHGPSLTEQFIQFLEHESESSLTSAQLPVATESTRMNADPLSQPSPRPTESVNALHNLLN